MDAPFTIHSSGTSGTTTVRFSAASILSATAATSIGSAAGSPPRGTAKMMTATTASVTASATIRLRVFWLARYTREDSALREAVSSGVSGRPSSATMRGCCAIIDRLSRARALGDAWSGSGRLQPSLRAQQPVFAARGKSLAALPQRQGVLEGRSTLLEFGDDTDELVAGLLERKAHDVGDAVIRCAHCSILDLLV
jgi:hypothetical protein